MAVQYGVDPEAKKLVSLCYKYDDNICEVPSDLIDKPQDAFYAVKNKYGWQTIKNGDWIIQEDNELNVFPNGLFTLVFEEKE